MDSYQLTVVNSRYAVTSPLGRPHFVAPATGSGPKLYVVVDGKEPVYVGFTTQSMGNRLRQGWSASGRSGYYGYAWRNQYPTVRLDIWHLDLESTPLSIDAETIEGEVVYEIRKRGQWPRWQTEIHFHPSSADHRRIALEIVSSYLS